MYGSQAGRARHAYGTYGAPEPVPAWGCGGSWLLLAPAPKPGAAPAPTAAVASALAAFIAARSQQRQPPNLSATDRDLRGVGCAHSKERSNLPYWHRGLRVAAQEAPNASTGRHGDRLVHVGTRSYLQQTVFISQGALQGAQASSNLQLPLSQIPVSCTV